MFMISISTSLLAELTPSFSRDYILKNEESESQGGSFNDFYGVAKVSETNMLPRKCY